MLSQNENSTKTNQNKLGEKIRDGNQVINVDSYRNRDGENNELSSNNSDNFCTNEKKRDHTCNKPLNKGYIASEFTSID